MFFQGRGNTYLATRDDVEITGPALLFCQDALSIALTTDSFEHINKCGPVDVPDYRGTKSSSGEVTFSYATVEDKKFAVGVLGTVNAAEVAPVAVTGELAPAGLVAGDVYFLGGIENHRNITSLVVTDSATSPGTLVLTSDYTFDASTGMVTIVDPSGFTQPLSFAYSHQDPASVSMLSAGSPVYFLRFENINKANNNDPGSLELYKVRFDPAALIDFLSDELQILELKGSVLADSAKAVTDTEFGQFGRRIL